jgi:TetR/AcrR family transcriptional regulator, ethionamide resistance regulator
MATQAKRIRRLPGDAEREILDAAEAFLSERPFRDMNVDELMARTGMRRSSFYHYFHSLDEVAIGLMRRVQGEMMQAASPWLEAEEDVDLVAAAEGAIRSSAEIFARHGTVLTAIHEASFQSEKVQDVWRHGVLEEWIRAIAAQLRVQRERGLIHMEEPEETARALLLMNTSVFVERLGKPPADSPEAVVRILAPIWVGAIYPEALVERRRASTTDAST